MAVRVLSVLSTLALAAAIGACAKRDAGARCPAADELHFARDGIDVTVRRVPDDAGIVHLRVHTVAPGMVRVTHHLRLVMRRADAGVALRSESTLSEDVPDASAPIFAPHHLETVTGEALDDDITIER